MAEDIVSNDQKSVVGVCERPAKRAEATPQCKDASITPSTTEFLALLTKWDDLKILCKALSLENHCTSELATEAKKLC